MLEQQMHLQRQQLFDQQQCEQEQLCLVQLQQQQQQQQQQHNIDRELQSISTVQVIHPHATLAQTPYSTVAFSDFGTAVEARPLPDLTFSPGSGTEPAIDMNIGINTDMGINNGMGMTAGTGMNTDMGINMGMVLNTRMALSSNTNTTMNTGLATAAATPTSSLQPLPVTSSFPQTDGPGNVAAVALPVRQALDSFIATSCEKPPASKEEAQAVLEEMFRLRAEKVRQAIEQGHLSTTEALKLRMYRRRESVSHTEGLGQRSDIATSLLNGQDAMWSLSDDELMATFTTFTNLLNDTMIANGDREKSALLDSLLPRLDIVPYQDSAGQSQGQEQR
ncbi:hypothetical protein BGZ94_000442 [Podila epigama]|nr:hypothetical protein BGZ94_000442 [Podila epigama]